MTSRTGSDFYRILGVERDASPHEIKHAYHVLVHRYHPDHNPDDDAAEEQFKDISEAYATLSDPVRRSEYDASLHPSNVAPRPVHRPTPAGRNHTRRVRVGLNLKVAGISLALGGISASIEDNGEIQELRGAVQQALRDLIETLE
jgi:curved DNA-binding protein CbpA